MLAPELFALFTRPLEVLGIPYFVTGSVASLVYGEPRLGEAQLDRVELDRWVASLSLEAVWARVAAT